MTADGTALAPGTDQRHLAWEAALDRLEDDVLASSLPLAADGPPAGGPVPLPAWEQPLGLGPIPPALLARARALHARQVELEQRLAAAVETARRLRATSGRAPGGTYAARGAPAAYLDLQA